MRRHLVRGLPISAFEGSPLRKGDVFELEIDPVEIAGADHFKPERLVVAEPCWRIDSILIEGREQLDQPLPSSLFGPGDRGHARWLDTLKSGSKLRVSATYLGDEVGLFRAVLMGVDVSPAEASRAFSGPVRFRDIQTEAPIAATFDGPDRVMPGESAWFVARPHCALRVQRIVLDLDCDEWLIEDIHVHGKSQHSQAMQPDVASAGAVAVSVSGEVFSPDSFRPALNFETVQMGMDFSIKATYRGSNPNGRFFGATCACRTVP